MLSKESELYNKFKGVVLKMTKREKMIDELAGCTACKKEDLEKLNIKEIERQYTNMLELFKSTPIYRYRSIESAGSICYIGRNN